MKNEKKEDYAELKERMLRLAAEFDNYKKRVKNDLDNARGIGKAELAASMLPILDEFELALLSVNGSDNKSLTKGIEMVYSNFVGMLKKEGLKEMETNGKFDPYKHEIVMAKIDAKRKPGTILEVTKKGYTFNGIVLRPASVIISKEENQINDDKNENNR